MAKLPEPPLLGLPGRTRSLEFQLTDLKWMELLQGKKMWGKSVLYLCTNIRRGELLNKQQQNQL